MGLIRHTRHTAARRATLAILCAALLTVSVLPAQAVTTDETERLRAAIAAAETTASAASQRAIDAIAEAERLRTLAEAASATAATLSDDSAAAGAALDEQRRRAATVAVELFRSTSDGPLIARLLTDADPESLLSRLAVLERTTSTTSRTVDSALAAARTASALRAQADLADAERDRLATEAEAQAERARAEADAEQVAVADAQRALDELYAQLAAIRQTTIAQERAARLAEQTAQQAAQPGGAAGGSAGGGGSSGGGSSTGGGSGGSSGGSSDGGTTPTPPVTSGPVMTPAEAQAHARGAIGAYGWGDDQFSCLVSLWNRESGWRVLAQNPSSGAYGIPQSLPGDKMASAGVDWRTNGATQIAWGLSYISSRYGSPCGAWAHSEQTGWY